MSDKPLAEGIENWAKKLEAESEIEIAQHLRGTILLIKDFAAEHLTEQTEQSAEYKGIAQTLLVRIERYQEALAPRWLIIDSLEQFIREHRNALSRRISELLVGKETK